MPTFCLVFLISFILLVVVLGGLWLSKRNKKAKKSTPQKPVDVSVINSNVSVVGDIKSKPNVQVTEMPTRSPPSNSGGSYSRSTGLSNHTHHNSNDHLLNGMVLGSVMSSHSHRDEDRCSGGYSSPTPSYSSGSDSGSDSGSSSSCSGGSYD